MFILTEKTLRYIHSRALVAAIANGILAGFFLGLLADPDRSNAMILTFFIASAVWTLLFLMLALRSRLHPDGYVSFRRDRNNLTTDAIGDLRARDDLTRAADGTAGEF